MAPPAEDGGSSTVDPVDGIPTEAGEVPAETVDDAGGAAAIETAKDEANLLPVTVPDGDEVSVEAALAAGLSSAEIALETLVSEELEESPGRG